MTKPQLTTNSLCLSTLCQSAIFPALPLLADTCQLSIIQLKYLSPVVIKVITYQLLTYQQNHTIHDLFQQIIQHPLVSNNSLSLGLNFKKIQQLQTEITPLRKQLFNQDIYFYSVLGICLTKTKISIQQLEKIFDWFCFLMVIILSSIIKKSELTIAQCEIWLQQQPIFMATSEDWILIEATGYRMDTSLAHMLQQQKQFIKQDYLNSWQNNLQQTMTDYLACRPLSICPSVQTTKPIIQASLDTSETEPVYIDIFAKPADKKTSWISKLQQHWIITTMVLSVIVFPTIAWLLPEKPYQDKQKSVEKSDDKEILDVAIVRIDGELSEQKPEKQSEKNSDKQNKADKVNKSEQTDKKSDK